jgi:hypothetical protein
MITFDSKGNIPSEKPIDVNLDELEQYFVYSQSDRIEWLHLFSRIRGQKLNKGFIKIHF